MHCSGRPAAAVLLKIVSLGGGQLGRSDLKSWQSDDRVRTSHHLTMHGVCLVSTRDLAGAPSDVGQIEL